MREVPRDKQFEDAGILPELVSAPSTNELVMITLMMRLYDIQLALLSHINKTQADELYDLHNEGGHLNPLIFIPEVEDVNDQ